MRCLLTLTVTTVIFRCDMLVLLAPLTLQMLLSGEVSLKNVLCYGIGTGAIALLITVLIDSYFWDKCVCVCLSVFVL